MASNGYDVQGVRLPTLETTPTPLEIEQAVVDVECKESTDLISTYVSVLYEYERSEIDRTKEEIEALRSWTSERLDNALRLLRESNKR
jgi:hypothetical protein